MEGEKEVTTRLRRCTLGLSEEPGDDGAGSGGAGLWNGKITSAASEEAGLSAGWRGSECDNEVVKGRQPGSAAGGKRRPGAAFC